MHLCMFAASMFGRTKAHAEHTSGQWKRVLEMGEKMQRVIDNASTEKKARMAEALSTPGFSKCGLSWHYRSRSSLYSILR